MILQVSVSKCRLCTSNFTKTVSIWKWSNTLFRFMSENMSYMYTPHAFNLNFLKNHLEFWYEIFRANLLKHKGTHERSFVKIWDGYQATFLKIASLEPEWPYSKWKYFCYQKSTPQIIFLVFARCAVLIHGGLLTMGRLCSLCHSGGDFIFPFKICFFLI